MAINSVARADGRVYLWSDPGPGQVVHLTVDGDASAPVLTMCGWYASPLWRMSVEQPIDTVLCDRCKQLV